MEARVYVDEDKKYSLWLEVRASRVDVSLQTYTMQDGYVVDSTGASAYEGDGGLIYVHRNGRLQNEGSVKITGAYATGNGGAVYSEGNVTLSHAKFIGNHSYGKGGAIYGDGIKLTLTDSTFSGNASDEGGAIRNLGGTTILDNVTFSCNSAIGDGGAIYGGDIDLRGDVYLSSASDTIWMEEDKTLNWTIDGNDNGYVSDFSLITGNVTAETFTIDAEDALVGHCYTLAGNAVESDGQTFTITVTGEDGAEEYTMKVNGETLLVNDVSYVLGVNDNNELTLSVNQHLVVEGYTLLIDSVQDFSWAGMDTYTGNGSIFEIKADGIMTNVFVDGEATCSYATSFTYGSVGKDDQGKGGNGGIIYNGGSVTLDSAYFESNTAEGNGGAIYSSNALYVTDGSFFFNEAEYGGAVYIAGGTGNYLSGTFNGNTATELGGAVYLASGAALSLGDTTFRGNEADEGGAIYSEGNILLTGELVLSSSDDNFVNLGTVTLDYASDASIRGYQYLMNDGDDAKVCISVEGLEAGQEICQYAFAKGDFSGDYEYVDAFTLTDGASETTITVDGGQVEFNGLSYSVEINETGDALILNAFAVKNISITLHDMEKTYDGLEMACTDYEISGSLGSTDELVFTVSDTITDAGSKQVDVSSWKVLRDGVDVSDEYNLTSTGATLTVTPREVTVASGSAVKVYDGTPLTCDTITITGDGFVENEGITCTVTGVQDGIGISENTFAYSFNEGTKAENYEITEKTGLLSMKALNPQEITITVDNLSKTYDGVSLQATYQYTQGVLAEGDELLVLLDHTSLTDAGKVSVTVEKYCVMRDGVDVTSGYKFAPIATGSLEVTKRAVTLTSGSAEKRYDGTSLTNDTITVSGDGWANGEGATYSVTGSQTDVGASANVFTYTLNANTKASNYDVTTKIGTLVVEVNLADPLVVTDASMKLPVDAAVSAATVEADGTLTLVNGAKLDVSGVTTLADGTLDAREGAFETAELRAASGKNTYLGATTGIADAAVYGGATLDLSRSQYDDLFDRDALAVDAAGLVKVTGGDDVSVGDVLGVIASDRVDAVAFAADLGFTVNKLGFYATKTVVNKTTFKNVGTDGAKVIGFGDAVGTVNADTITFGAGTDLALGSEGKTLDLLAGTNTVKVEKNADAEVASDLVNVTRVTLATGTKVKVAGVYEQQRTTLDLADVTFSADRAGTLSTGRYADITAGNLVGSEAKGLSLSLGMDGTFAAGKVSNVRTLTVGSRSTATIAGDVSAVNRLTLSNGTYDRKTAKTSLTTFAAAAVTGTAKNDSFSFGNYSDVDLTSLDLGEGNDTLRIGSNAEVEITSLDFGDGTRDALTIGASSTLKVNVLDVDSLDTLSMGKNAKLYLGADSYDAAMETAWGKKYGAQISKLA